MSFLLNQDTVVAYLRNVRRVVRRFAQHQGSLFLSAVTLMGLELWLLRVNTPVRHAIRFRSILQLFTAANIDEPIAHRAASIGSKLRAQARRLTTVELLVAGTAIERGYTLVTHNGVLYANIPGLTVVDWSALTRLHLSGKERITMYDRFTDRARKVMQLANQERTGSTMNTSARSIFSWGWPRKVRRRRPLPEKP